jgi:hypothetical protein
MLFQLQYSKVLTKYSYNYIIYFIMQRYADQERFQGPLPDLADSQTHTFAYEDGSGPYSVTVRVSGDPKTAETLIIRPMPWSDHPNRGFEVVRESAIAGLNPKLAVVGISLPGMGRDEIGPTRLQREALESVGFGRIAEGQWRAAGEALGIYGVALAGKEMIVAGESLAASNAVGLIETLPQGVKVRDIGLRENCAFKQRRPWQLGREFITTGSRGQADYLRRNPDIDFDAYGYEIGGLLGLGRQVARQPYTHCDGTIVAMARGEDAGRLSNAYRDRELEATIHLWTGSESIVAKPEYQAAAAAVLRFATQDIDLQVHEGEHHSAHDFLGLAVGQHRELVFGPAA